MYHDYYDIIHSDYDYALDVEIIKTASECHNIRRDSLMEIGCGTGRHTELLSKEFISLIAMDIDPEMIKRAKEHLLKKHIKNVRFVLGSALELDQLNIGSVCMTCALFNVINYITEFDPLVKLFNNIPSRYWIFDCLDAEKKYNPTASFDYSYVVGEKKYNRTINSLYDLETQLLQVNEVYSGALGKNPSFFQQLYKMWNQEQIKCAAKAAGFEILTLAKKGDFNSNYRKQNQLICIMKRKGN